MTLPNNHPGMMTLEEALKKAFALWEAAQPEQAVQLCQRILEVVPEQSDAHHLLGIIAFSNRNLDLAIAHLRQACLAPNSSASNHSNLAEMCRQRGLLEDAEQAARRAVALGPDMVAAWNNLGIILQEAGKYEESIACLERVAAKQPNNPEVHNNLGNTCKRLGLYDRAETHYTTSLKLNPNYVKAHSNLSNLLKDLGQFERAAQAVNTALSLDPQFEDGYINLAAIQTSLGHYDQTLQTLDNLLSFAPNNALALAAKAVTLKHFDRLDEALSIAKQALEIAPESADIHNAIGQILQRLNRFDEALEAYDRAANLPGIASESAQVNRAIVLNETGSKSEALAMLDQTIKAFPRSASAWFSRADLKTFTADDPEIGRMESLLSSNSEVQSFSDRMALHFALGKAYLDVGAGEDAFRHLNQGNGMKRSTVSFDIQKTVEWMQSFSTVFSKEFMESRSGGHPSTLPIFIVGVPRSGTTLIEQILASHPDVYGAGELRHLQSVVDQIKNYPSGVMSTTASDYSRLGQIYHDRVMSLAGDHRHVIDKMPANFMHLGVIQLALPNARIIHCRRDPVDTCLSCYSKLFNAEQAFTYDLNELGLFYQAYQRMMDHWRTIMSPDRFIEVDYESVVDDVDTQARRLLEFLGLPWDETCTRFYENKRSVRTASVNQVRQPIYKTSSGRWKKFAPQLGPLLSVLDVKSR